MSAPYSDSLWHGASWYPELWPDHLDEDLTRMRELGLNCLRLGDSVWSVIEPADGYPKDLAWAVEKKIGTGRVAFAAWSKDRCGDLLARVLAGLPLRRTRTSGPAVFVLPRETTDGRAGYIATNTDRTSGWIETDRPGTDRLTGQPVPAGRVELPPFAVLAVLHS